MNLEELNKHINFYVCPEEDRDSERTNVESVHFHFSKSSLFPKEIEGEDYWEIHTTTQTEKYGITATIHHEKIIHMSEVKDIKNLQTLIANFESKVGKV